MRNLLYRAICRRHRVAACTPSRRLGARTLWAACVVLLLDAGAASAEPPQPGLVVLGVVCDAHNAEWRAGLVGFGIENWVAQALYDTQRFRLLEEKSEVLQAVRANLDAEYPKLTGRTPKELEAVARALQADYVAVGRVSSFFARPQGVRVGPLQNLQRDTLVKVELTLFHAQTGKTTHGEATGKVGRSRTTIMADTAAGKLPFDPTTVAPATQQAVEGAVAKLIPGYRPRPRSVEEVQLPRPVVFGVLPLSLRPEVAQRYPELKQRRVSLGLHNRVLRAVSTHPECRLQEINPEVLQALELQWWVSGNGVPPAEDVVAQARDFSRTLDWVVYGEVFSFAVHQREKLQGLSGSVGYEVTVGVQLRAVCPRTETTRYYVASGMGREVGDWEAWKGSDADFTQTFVGKAVQKAVETAWPALLHDLADHLPPPPEK
ncbi:MAG: hypothetical protein QHJ73_06790 [Armatimonadota bacterium]|nr:hypothetical protein [Armatimonadota bacterium]